MSKFSPQNCNEVFKYFSGRAGREQQRAGRIRDSGGTTGQGEAGEALGAEEDQARGHDHIVPTTL